MLKDPVSTANFVRATESFDASPLENPKGTKVSWTDDAISCNDWVERPTTSPNASNSSVTD